MAQEAFGGAHTAKKLAKLEAYLKAYLDVFKNQSWVNIYFDAFAGTGKYRPLRVILRCRSTTMARPSLLDRPNAHWA